MVDPPEAIPAPSCVPEADLCEPCWPGSLLWLPIGFSQWEAKAGAWRVWGVGWQWLSSSPQGHSACRAAPFYSLGSLQDLFFTPGGLGVVPASQSCQPQAPHSSWSVCLDPTHTLCKHPFPQTYFSVPTLGRHSLFLAGVLGFFF